MPPKKKNHFVPQFYFRNFGNGDSISLFNIERKLHIPTASIAGQCQRDYLYGKDTGIEDALKELEDRVAQVVRDLIETEKLPEKLSPQYIALVTFISLQMSRCPKDGDAMTQTMTAMLRAALRDDPKLPAVLRASLDSVEVTHENPVPPFRTFRRGLSTNFRSGLFSTRSGLNLGLDYLERDCPHFGHDAAKLAIVADVVGQ